MCLSLLLYLLAAAGVRLYVARAFAAGDYRQAAAACRWGSFLFPPRGIYARARFCLSRDLPEHIAGRVAAYGFVQDILTLKARKLVPRLLKQHKPQLTEEIAADMVRFYLAHKDRLSAREEQVYADYLFQLLGTDIGPPLSDWLARFAQDAQGLFFYAIRGRPHLVRAHKDDIIRYVQHSGDPSLLSAVVAMLSPTDLDALWQSGRAAQMALLDNLDKLPQATRSAYLLAGLSATDMPLFYKAVQRSQGVKLPAVRELLLKRLFTIAPRYTDLVVQALAPYAQELIAPMGDLTGRGSHSQRLRASRFLRRYAPGDVKDRLFRRATDWQVSYNLSAADADVSGLDAGEYSLVLLVSIDTLRKDHLGLYGYSRDTSPHMDAFFSKHSIVYDRCMSHSPWTLPAHVSLLASQDTYEHRVRTNQDVIGPDSMLLAESLRAQGYFTAAFTTHVLVSQAYHFDRGFDVFEYHQELPAAAMIDKVLAFLRWYIGRMENKRLFVFLHLFDPHEPYRPPAGFDRFSRPAANGFQAEMDRYDGEILYTDHHLGRLLGALQRTNLLQHGLLVVTADHGEEFMDHGAMGHGHSLYNELLNVPLMVRHHRLTQARSRRLVQLKDIPAAVMAFLALPVPEQFSGAADIFSRPAGPEPRPVFSEVAKSHLHKASLIQGSYKLIVDFSANSRWCYDLDRDPGETRPMEACDTLAPYLYFIQAKSGALPEETQEQPVLSEEAEKRLRALGYLD